MGRVMILKRQGTGYEAGIPQGLLLVYLSQECHILVPALGDLGVALFESEPQAEEAIAITLAWVTAHRETAKALSMGLTREAFRLMPVKEVWRAGE